MSFEPKIVAFLCNWCSYRGSDLAGSSRMKWPTNVKPIRVMCSGRIDPAFILKALKDGADGVLVLGCHPGDCHYESGNYKSRRRMALLSNMLDQLGIEPDRVRLEWVSASEGNRFVSVVSDMTVKVKALGPLHQAVAD